MSLYNKPYTPPSAVMRELDRNGTETRYPGSTFCNCCGSTVIDRNSPVTCYPNYGYVCWISDTKVEEQAFPEFFIEVLPLEDGTFLVIKGNTEIPEDNDD